ncbi:MAG: MarR family transcriptional regulator [Spirochaetota bacterium]|nr:MAG: MarR family transcriptional regulator [Spirochaetota bacterium]
MDSEQYMGRWISILYRYNQMYLSRELEPLNIGAGQHPILKVLFNRDGIHQEDIVHSTCMDKGTVAKSIKRLLEQGYIVKKGCPEDRRACRIFLTSKAHEIKSDLDTVLSRWTDIVTADFSKEEKVLVFSLLQRMAYNAEQYLLEKKVEDRK